MEPELVGASRLCRRKDGEASVYAAPVLPAPGGCLAGGQAPGRESQLPGQLRDSIRPLGSRPVSLDSRTDVESPVLTPHPRHSLSSLPGSQGLCHGDAWTSTGKQGGRRQTAATLTCRGARSVSPAGSSTDPRLAENVGLNGPLPPRNETPVVTTCAQ